MPHDIGVNPGNGRKFARPVGPLMWPSEPRRLVRLPLGWHPVTERGRRVAGRAELGGLSLALHAFAKRTLTRQAFARCRFARDALANQRSFLVWGLQGLQPTHLSSNVAHASVRRSRRKGQCSR